MNNELMEKVSNLMQSSELVFLRGQLRNILRTCKDDGNVYYLADLRVPRTLDAENVYSVSFNVCHVCFSADFVKTNNMTDETMKSFKDNEVLVNLDINSSIKSYKSDGNTFKSNNVKFFVRDIIKLSNVSKLDFSERKVVSL